MLSEIKTDLRTLEYMVFFWQSSMDGEKVAEYYLQEVADLPDMAVLYDGEFTAASVRTVLSAITNRERLNTEILKEKQFWNNNMAVTEDREVLDMMLSPIKTLNLSGIKDELNARADIPFGTAEIAFIPGIKEEYTVRGNRIYVNFFKVMVDLFGGTGEVTICGKSPEEYIKQLILSMDGVKPR